MPQPSFQFLTRVRSASPSAPMRFWSVVMVLLGIGHVIFSPSPAVAARRSAPTVNVGRQETPAMAPDGAGGGIVARTSHRIDEQRVDATGQLGGVAGDGSWSLLVPVGMHPSARFGHSAIYDPVRERMLVFGGQDTPSLQDDTWALSLTDGITWSEITIPGYVPPGRYDHDAIYDVTLNRMVVFGGAVGQPGNWTRTNEVWEFSFPDPHWAQLVSVGPGPTARTEHSLAYDPVRQQLILFGGADGSARSDLWALSLHGSPVWTELSAAGVPPLGRYGHTMVYDSERDRFLLFGGYSPASSFNNDVWALTVSGSPAWEQIIPDGAPPPRYGHVGIYDARRDRMVVFGGYDGSFRGDTWALSLSGSPAWTELQPAGVGPGGLYDATAIYDP